MIDFTSELGTRELQRIREDFFLWLTTIDAKGFPQPRPVWFTWDGEAFLVYSQPGARKLQHIENNPNVAINFDGGPKGLDVPVILATAEVVNDPIPANQIVALIFGNMGMKFAIWVAQKRNFSGNSAWLFVFSRNACVA